MSISQAIEEDPSLASASMTHWHQLHNLIIPFCSQLPQDKPIVIVLDALDEGYSDDLLEVLVKGIIKLSGVFQFVITSRNVVQIKILLAAPHVHHKAFDHSDGSNLEDVEKVIHEGLGKVATWKELSGWPSRELENQMKERSGGLMIWVVAVCQYLKQPELYDPQSDLQALLDSSLPDEFGAEEQMDMHYATILQQWKWKDSRFVEAYKQIMGTILVSKIPLSALAIESLHFGKVKVGALLPLLKPLLLSLDEGQAIQLLHQSLHDLLTGRAHGVDSWKVFAIDKKLQNQTLALLCINIINTEMSEKIPGTGYLRSKRGIPKISNNVISEHLSYACRFWMEHFNEIQEPKKELVDALHTLLEQKFVLWLEISASAWQNVDVEPLIKWINVRINFLLY